ncbi:MAG: DoxX family protein [Brevundimonas sp.]|uniref:DoxX family protein n=1 Tax=Brevundimonas sp. TaxID=1871086 RepID=UPI0028D46141|nr:DoxX family protein [uncultured Brevundimonas sp.]
MIDLYRALGLGVPALMDVAPLIARIVVGGMFFLSGFYKLFTPTQAEKMQKTMVEAGVAAPRQTARFVSVCEFVFGALLIMGLLTSLAALVLLAICAVALVTVASKSVKGASLGFRLSSYFDLPETLLMVILVWLIANGPGLWSLDFVLFLPRF